jgi:cysteinyl-tRNA synthetase
VAAVLSRAAAVGLVPESETVGPDEAAAVLAAQRDDARAARDWGRADALRAELERLGYIVEDTPQGTQIRLRRR